MWPTASQTTGTLKKNPKWQWPPSCLFKDSDFCHAFYFMVPVWITFFRNTCINPTTYEPIESRTKPLATVAIIANRREWYEIVFDELHNIQQEPVIVYICTPIGLFATTLHYGGATFRAALPKYKSQYDNCRNFKIHGRKRTQKCVRSLFGSMWMLHAMIWHFWRQFGNKLQFWQWLSKIRWQCHNVPMTAFFYDVNLHWHAVEMICSA